MKISDSLTQSLKTLNSDVSHSWPDETKGRAPHKQFLLLSILEGVEQGWIPDNRVILTHLIETFFSYWNRVIGDRKMTLALPYLHMKKLDQKYLLQRDKGRVTNLISWFI